MAWWWHAGVCYGWTVARWLDAHTLRLVVRVVFAHAGIHTLT